MKRWKMVFAALLLLLCLLAAAGCLQIDIGNMRR
jgi:hypothetical protein